MADTPDKPFRMDSRPVPDHGVPRERVADRTPIEQNPGCWVGWDDDWPTCGEGSDWKRDGPAGPDTLNG